MEYQLNIPLDLKNVDDAGVIRGMASTFDNIDLDGDVIKQGAFASGLAKAAGARRNIPMLDHHNMSAPIGRWTKILETDQGLEVEGKLTLEVQRAKELYALAKDGALGGMSIGFATKASDYDRSSGIRTITEADIYEISLVALPANTEARISGVKTAGNIETRVEFERALCQRLGFSRNAAKSIAANGFKGDARNEPSVSDPEDLRKAIDGLNRLVTGL